MTVEITRSKKLSDPPPYQRLRPGQLDNVAEGLLALGRELWVLTDRLMVVEAILEAKGIVLEDEIERFQPSADLEARLKAKRDRLVGCIEGALRGA